MARRSTRQSLSTTPRNPPKRSAPDSATSVRQSKRSKGPQSTKTTPVKSKYFDADSEKEFEDTSALSESDLDEASGYEDEAHESEESSPSEIESDEAPSDHSSKRGKKPKGKKSAATKATPKRSATQEELWRTGAETGLAPGTQLIIKKPKAREAGSTPYKDNTIHPNTMLFLQDLAKNNDRQWLKMHDPDFRQSQGDFNSFVECLTQKVMGVDETIPELPAKDIIFRIHRDMRFSKDKTPYKSHFSAAWSRTGRKGPYAAYYVHIQPGASFVGGGLWQPEADKLAALRRDFDRKPHRIRSVLTGEQLRKEFLGVNAKDEKRAVKAFAGTGYNKETALKTKPKGYENDHKHIELLRLRNFTIGKELADKEVIGPKGIDRISHLISGIVPFVTYLNSVVMPDNAEASSDDEDGQSEEHDSDSGSTGSAAS